LAKKTSSPVEDMKKFIAKKATSPKPVVKTAAPKLLDEKKK
jgi:hypothetical protein